MPAVSGRLSCILVERCDVAVVGAGPAGSVTAVHLARAGARVLLLDKARFPRDKPCGGGLTGHARAALDGLGLAVRVPHVPCTEGRIVYRGWTRDVSLHVVVGFIERLPDAVEIGPSTRQAGSAVRLRWRSTRQGQKNSGPECVMETCHPVGNCRGDMPVMSSWRMGRVKAK